MTKVTLTNLYHEKERVNLPAPHFDTHRAGQEDFTGIWITALYAGPKTGRKFAQVWSIWEHNQGEIYEELDEADYLKYCAKVGCEPENITATEV